MRILRVLAPDADEALALQVRDAVIAFNRGLDIRLRFLAIVVEDREVRVTDAESAAAVVGEALEGFGPSVVLLHGGGATALAAARVAAATEAVVARLGAGGRDTADADVERALDRVCGLLLALDEASAETLQEEGLGDRTTRLAGGSELGHQVIKALRAERVRRRGDATC